MDKWRPEGFGADFKFNESMAPLENFRNDLQIVKGFAQVEGNPGKDGAGDHARANATFLTGARPLRTSGANLRVGTSADQLAARFLSAETRMPSLELTCERVRNTGACDAGYSCAYQYNISWRSEHLPATPESNPRAVFERIYGIGSPKERVANAARRHAEQKSILDFVQDSAQKMGQRLGREDREKLDEYLTGVREVEQRIERVERLGPPADPGRPAPDGTPRDYREHIRILFDMMLLAFRSDSTRVVSFLLGHDGSNRSFRDIGVSGGHHDLSHHGKDEEKIGELEIIEKAEFKLFGEFLTKLKATRENGKCLLDHTAILFGSNLGNASSHNTQNLPIIVAGGGYKHGSYVAHDADDNTPLCDLFVPLAQRMGVETEKFGSSTKSTIRGLES